MNSFNAPPSPFLPEPSWYDRFWLTPRPEQPPVRLPLELAKLAVSLALVFGSGVLLVHGG